MSKSINIGNVAFGNKPIGAKAQKHTTIENIGTESVDLQNLTADNAVFNFGSPTDILMPDLPASSTIWYGENGTIQDTNGEYYTTDQGRGIFCTTNGSKVPTILNTMPSINISSPLTGEFELEVTSNVVTWSANGISKVDIIITGTKGGSKIYADVDASLGSRMFIITSVDGFVINDTFSIEIKNSAGSTFDLVEDLDTVASIEITAPAGSAYIAMDIDFICSGNTNANTVDIYAVNVGGTEFLIATGVSVVAGSWSKSDCQISSSDFSDSDTVKIRVKDSDNLTNYEDVSVTAKEASITNLATDPVEPQQAVDFEFSGDASDLDGETLTLEYSTDEISWNSLGTASVSSGSWSKADCQISSEGTYYLRARFGAVVYSASLEVEILNITLSIDTIPASQAMDVNFTIDGDSNDIAESETVTIYGKKSTDAWTAKVQLGTASVQADGSWETTTAQIPSTDFAVSDTVNVRAEYGSVISSVDDVTVASAGFEKLQIGSYYDTTAMADVNAINQIDDVVYDSAEDCYFVAGRTQQNNFYNSGVTTVPAYDRPFFMRVELDGTVTWCNQFPDASKYELAFMGKLKIYNSKLFFSCNIQETSGTSTSGNRTVIRIEKDGTGLISNSESTGQYQTRIVDLKGSDIILFGSSSSALSFRKIDTGLSSFGIVESGSTGNVTVPANDVFTRTTASGLLVSPRSVFVNDYYMYYVPYVGSVYAFGSMTTPLTYTFANASTPYTYGMSQDGALAVVRGDDTGVFERYLLDSGGVNSFNNERGEIWDVGDSTNYYMLTATGIIKFNSTTFTALATILVTDIDTDAVLVTRTYDNYDASGSDMLLCGYTDGDFADDSSGNTTRNGIIWITPLPEE